MRKYIIILIFICTSVYAQTGLFVDKNKSAFGVWGGYQTAVDCDYCISQKNLRFNYLSSFNLEITFTRNNLIYPSYYNSYNHSFDSWGLGYYFDAATTKVGMGYTYADVYSAINGSTKQHAISLIAKSNYNQNYNDGLVVELSSITTDEKFCEYSYYSSYDDNFYCESYYSYSYTNEILTVGSFFEMNSYVFGIAYKNFTEEFFNIDSGVLLLSIGTIFSK